jgi:hypothetical protein
LKYIIIDPNDGVFLGTRSDDEMGGVGMLFSAHNFLELTQAVSWKTRREAFSYMHKYIRPHLKHCFVAEIESYTDSSFVTIYDICRSGYGDHGTEMIDALPMPNNSVH